MTQLTNGQHACMLMFVPVTDTFNIPCDYQFVFFSVLDELYYFIMLDAMLDAVDNIVKVPYQSLKCDVSFSQGSVITLLW